MSTEQTSEDNNRSDAARRLFHSPVHIHLTSSSMLGIDEATKEQHKKPVDENTVKAEAQSQYEVTLRNRNDPTAREKVPTSSSTTTGFVSCVHA